MNRGLSIAAATLAAALAFAVAPSGAAAARGLVTGLQDFAYGSADAAARDTAFDRTVAANAGLIRVNVAWSSVATAQPVNPTDPSDPAYDFSSVDRAVTGAAANGLDVLLTVYSAPDFAEGADKPENAAAGAWKPDPAAFGAFAEALATRYSGQFAGLPRVRYYEAWNEPNLPSYLSPQWRDGAAFAAAHYRLMLDRFYGAVKAVDASNAVLAGALAPYGDPAADNNRMRPLRFLRALLCLDGHLKRARCPDKPAFDILSHHPIDLSGGARTSAINPDDVATPDLGRLVTTLRAAERRNTIAGGKRHHRVWATELWWMSNPPEAAAFANLDQQARWVQEALFLLWKDGARVVVNLPLIDPGGSGLALRSGLLFANGKPKPSYRSFSFPFVTERRSKAELFAWGKAPLAGKLRIEELKGGGWRPIAAERVRAGGVFTKRLEVAGAAKLRASIGGQTSLVWAQRR